MVFFFWISLKSFLSFIVTPWVSSKQLFSILYHLYYEVPCLWTQWRISIIVLILIASFLDFFHVPCRFLLVFFTLEITDNSLNVLWLLSDRVCCLMLLLSGVYLSFNWHICSYWALAQVCAFSFTCRPRPVFLVHCVSLLHRETHACNSWILVGGMNSALREMACLWT